MVSGKSQDGCRGAEECSSMMKEEERRSSKIEKKTEKNQVQETGIYSYETVESFFMHLYHGCGAQEEAGLDEGWCVRGRRQTGEDRAPPRAARRGLTNAFTKLSTLLLRVRPKTRPTATGIA